MHWLELTGIGMNLGEDEFTIQMVFQKVGVTADPLLTSEHVDVQPLEAEDVVLTSVWQDHLVT